MPNNQEDIDLMTAEWQGEEPCYMEFCELLDERQKLIETPPNRTTYDPHGWNDVRGTAYNQRLFLIEREINSRCPKPL